MKRYILTETSIDKKTNESKFHVYSISFENKLECELIINQWINDDKKSVISRYYDHNYNICEIMVI